MSRPTSARQAGSRPAAADWTAGLRSQSATGASASRPEVPKHWQLATTAPCSWASAATSVTRRVLPTPAPPRTSARPERPAAAARHTSWSRPSSADRPTSWAAASPAAAAEPAAPGAGRRACVGHQPLEHLPCRRVRDDAQLALQDRSAVVVGADRAGPVAQVGLQLHQRAVADLLQRLQLNPAAGGIHRPGQVAAARPGLGEQVAQVHALALELRPGLEQPVLVRAGQQVAPVLGDGRGGVGEDLLVIAGRGRRQRRLALDVEDAQVDAAGLGVAPAQVRGRHDQRRLVAQDLAQLMQLAAQVGQRLRIGRLRPEQPGDPLPGLRRPGVHDQERDQGNASATSESGSPPRLPRPR